jgi:hypothetical protein
MTDFYIGTATEYNVGDTVNETIFYNDPELARIGAQRRAEEVGQLFGMVYKVSHGIDETLETAERFPHKVIEMVDWSI